VSSAPTLLAAFAMGVLASAHCSVMCGGIAGALALGAGKDGTRWPILLGYQFGRIASYALAGASIAGIGAIAVSWLDIDAVRRSTRIATSLVLAIAGLSLLGVGRSPGQHWGTALWRHLAPLGRRFLPMRHAGQALAFGAVWGWMPCGFVYTVLLLAWLSMSPWHSAAIMLAFGLGTMPALLLVQWRVRAAHASLQQLGSPRLRRAGGWMLLLFALLTLVATLAGPQWLGWAHRVVPFDCFAI